MSTPNRPTSNVSDAEITAYLKSKPGMSDKDIRSAMDKHGVNTTQMARATGMKYGDVQSRYNKAGSSTTPKDPVRPTTPKDPVRPTPPKPTPPKPTPAVNPKPTPAVDPKRDMGTEAKDPVRPTPPKPRPNPIPTKKMAMGGRAMNRQMPPSTPRTGPTGPVVNRPVSRPTGPTGPVVNRPVTPRTGPTFPTDLNDPDRRGGNRLTGPRTGSTFPTDLNDPDRRYTTLRDGGKGPMPGPQVNRLPTKMASGGKASSRADGVAQRGKTNCKMR